ncbi:MAG: hypothetical protein M1840_003897 [Geoglossum simile]|nr:MAG: hypothetical protein M1840_003897 [Geoglossum simile]
MHKGNNIEAIVQKCDLECLVTERDPVQDPYTSNEVGLPPKMIVRKGTPGQSSYVSQQYLSEESINTIPEARNISPGLELPNGQRPNTSSDQSTEPFRPLNYVPEDAPGSVEQTVADTATESPHPKEDRISPMYPLGSTPAKESGVPKAKPSDNADGIPQQNTPEFDQDAEGIRLFTPAHVASTVAAMSTEITKVAASLTPKFLSKVAIEQVQEIKSTDPGVIVIEDEDPIASNQSLDITGDISVETISNLLPNGKNNRLGQIGHCTSTGNMKISSGSDSPLSERIKFQIEELLKSGLSNLLAKGARSAGYNGATVGGNNGPIHAKGKVKCLFCKKVLPRDCDMNKHVKRHTRPFGCTYPSCNKMFGSKNDWKRHENTQHFQLEMWRCRETENINGKECARLFYRREAFQQHLRQQHNILDADKLKDEARIRRIGRNGQVQFWCGFCKLLVPLKYRGLDAWDERFNHIGNHFTHNQKIDEWVPIDSNRPKGETWPETSMEGKDWQGTEGHSPDDDSANTRDRQPSPEKASPQNAGQSPAAVVETIESRIEGPSRVFPPILRGLQGAVIHEPPKEEEAIPAKIMSAAFTLHADPDRLISHTHRLGRREVYAERVVEDRSIGQTEQQQPGHELAVRQSSEGTRCIGW